MGPGERYRAGMGPGEGETDGDGTGGGGHWLRWDRGRGTLVGMEPGVTLSGWDQGRGTLTGMGRERERRSCWGWDGREKETGGVSDAMAADKSQPRSQ